MRSLAFVTLFLSTSAFASTDHFVEMQIDSAVLGAIAERQLAAERSFCPYQIPCPFNSNSACYVDHFTIGSAGTWSRDQSLSNIAINGFTTLPAQKISYHQPLTVHVKTLACANNPNCFFTTPYPANAVYELYMGSNGDLCLTTDALTGAPAGVIAPETEVCLELNPQQVLSMSGQTSGSMSGAAVSMNEDGTRIAARIELGRSQAEYSSSRINAWGSFLDGSLAPEGGGAEWSMYIDQNIFLTGLKQRIAEGLLAISGVALDTPIAATWTGLGSSGGAIALDFDITMSDTPCPNDISAYPILGISTGMNAAQDGLASNGSVAWNPDGWDIFVCGLAFGGPIGSLVLTGLAGAIDFDISGLGSGCQASGDSSFSCDQKTHPQSMSLGPGQSAAAKLDAVVGSSSGLTMRGALDLLGGGGALTTNVWLQSPNLGVRGGCSALGCGYQGGLSVSGTARLCNVQFSNDPLGIFDITYPPDLSMPANFPITIDPSADAAAYMQNPYGVRATVWSSNGIRTYEFPDVEILSASQKTFLCGSLLVYVWATQCLQPDVPFEPPWQGCPEIWDPDWTFDQLHQAAVRVVDQSGRFVDYGMVTDLWIDVVRDRNVVRSVTIRGKIYAGLGAQQVDVQPLAIGLRVPAGMDQPDDRQVIAALLPSGYRGAIQIGANQFDLYLSPVQLAAAAH